MLRLRSTELDGVAEIERTPWEDERGRFTRLFDRRALLDVGWHWPVVHINLSETAYKGTVRGFHYQVLPTAEAKMVTCVRGTIWDVVVDVREGSPTFLQWCARWLDGGRLNSMLVPPGFAHGFQTTCDDVTVMYIHSAEHSPADERGIDATDELIGARWPLPVARRSARDRSFPPLDATFLGVTL